MAIARVQTVKGSSAGSSAVSATLSSTSAGNFLVATLDVYSNPSAPTITPPAGWNQAGPPNTAQLQTAAIYYYENNPGGVTAVAFNLSAAASSATVVISEYSGIATSGALDQYGIGSAAGTPAASGSVTTTVANELLIGAMGNATAGTFSGATGSFTIEDQKAEVLNGQSAVGFLDRIVAATGTYSTTAAYTGGGGSAGCIASFSDTAIPSSAAQLGWFRPPVGPTLPPKRTAWTGYAFPGEPSLAQDYPPTLLANWFRPLQEPVRPPPSAQARLGWVTAPWDPATLDVYRFEFWFQPTQQPVRPPPAWPKSFYAQGNVHEAASDSLFLHWDRPTEQPVRPPPRVFRGWFAAGYDPTGQSYGVPDWFAPVIQPVRTAAAEARSYLRPNTREGLAALPLDPTATNSGMAFAWHVQTGRPRALPPTRQEGLFVRPLEPTALDLGGLTQWFQPAGQPTRRPPAPTPGWFTLTMSPDALGVIRLDAWFAPLSVPLRRPGAEPIPGTSPRQPGAFVRPLEPTQLSQGESGGWQMPTARPVVRPTTLFYTRPWTVDGPVWWNVPDLSSYFVPLAVPVRPQPPRQQGAWQYAPPPEMWYTGVVVSGPFFCIAADFFQAGAVVGQTQTT